MLTEILAVWGALLSTVALLWNVRRDFSNAGRLKLRCFIGDLASFGVGVLEKDVLVWQATNVGKEPVVLTHFGGARDKNRHLLLHSRVQLPHTLKPGEYVMDYTKDLSILNADLKSLYVCDSLGRKYYAPRREFKALIKGNRK